MANAHSQAAHENAAHDPCCGLYGIQPLEPPVSPFKDGVFNFSQYSLNKARQIVDEGKSKVHALDQVIDKLQKHRDQTHRFVLDHQEFLPPVAHVPDDFLLSAFDQAIGYHSWDPLNGTLWSISAVCRRWRNLALSSRGLWTRIALDLEYERHDEQIVAVAEKRVLLACRRAQIQLDRSGQEPLQCALNFERLKELQDPSIHSLVKRLLLTLDRCVTLELRPISQPAYFELPLVTFPILARLRKLTITDCYHNSHKLLQPGSLLARPLAIRALEFHWSRLPRAMEIPHLLFKTVTYLDIGFCTAPAADIVALLYETLKLRTLRLLPIIPYLLPKANSMPPVLHNAVLPFLTELELSFYAVDMNGAMLPVGHPDENHIIQQVVGHIHVPNIVALRAQGADERDMRRISIACLGRTMRPAASLHHLSLYECTSPDMILHLITFLSGTPNIQTFEIAAAHYTIFDIDPLLQALEWVDEGDTTVTVAGSNLPGTREEHLDITRLCKTGKLCPRLRKLRLTGCTMSDTALQEMLDTRGFSDENEDEGEDEEEEVAPTDSDQVPARLRCYIHEPKWW